MITTQDLAAIKARIDAKVDVWKNDRQQARRQHLSDLADYFDSRITGMWDAWELVQEYANASLRDEYDLPATVAVSEREMVAS